MKPYADVRHKAFICKNATYNDLMKSILDGLNKHSDYEDIQQQIRQNQHNIIIQIGSPAKTENDLIKSQIINNNNIVNINDIVNIKSNKCVFVIHGIHIKKQILKSKTINKRNTQKPNTNIKTKRTHLSQNNNKTTNKTNTNKRKRKRINEISENNNNNKPLKKRKKIKLKLAKSNSKKSKSIELTSKELKYECLWILIDGNYSLIGDFEQNTPKRDRINKINKINKVEECIDNIINKNWNKNDCPTHYISLYSYNKYLNKQTNVLEYSNKNKKLILDSFNNIKLKNNTKSMQWFNAILELINIIQFEKDNIKCGNHRIVLFCGKICKATRATSNTMEKNIVNNVGNKLGKLNIIFDVIQIAYSHRQIGDIQSIANRYWSSIQNDVVLCPDFMNPQKRTIGKEDAIVID